MTRGRMSSIDEIKWHMPYPIRESEGYTQETLRQELEQAGAQFLYTSHTEENDDEPIDEVHVRWYSKRAFNRYNEYRAMKRILASDEGAYLTSVFHTTIGLPPSVAEALKQVVKYYGKGLDVLVVPVSQEALHDE